MFQRYSFLYFGVFRNVQNIRSHESILMQLTDFMMGAISYLHNDDKKQNAAKMQIIEKIKHHSKEGLEKTNYLARLEKYWESNTFMRKTHNPIWPRRKIMN